jgi:putative SOS response-associated peptidase YedK
MPATSYFEWKEVKGRKKKIPYLIQLKSQEIFSLGGLWVEQEDQQGNIIEKFALITQVPNKKLSFIHCKM